MTSPPRAIWRALVPAWFVFVGVVALCWLPPPTVAMGALLLVITTVLIPSLVFAVDGWETTRR